MPNSGHPAVPNAPLGNRCAGVIRSMFTRVFLSRFVSEITAKPDF